MNKPLLTLLGVMVSLITISGVAKAQMDGNRAGQTVAAEKATMAALPSGHPAAELAHRQRKHRDSGEHRDRDERRQGVRLRGEPDQPAIDAMVDMLPVGVPDIDIANGVILTRLDAHLAPGTTVRQVNAALEMVDGGIVTMLRGHPTLTIAIPRAEDLRELQEVREQLRAAPGVSHVELGHGAVPKVLPDSVAGNPLVLVDEMFHLLPARFPAAWNAAHLAKKDCATRRVPILVADDFSAPLPGGYARFAVEIPHQTMLRQPPGTAESHGFDVTTTMAALFDGQNPTGANPFSECLEINLLDLSNLTPFEKSVAMSQAAPAGKFLLNYSLGYVDRCEASGCTADQVGTVLDLPLGRAYEAADWKTLTSSRWGDFLALVAAGNERNKSGTQIYAGLGVAAFDSALSIATLQDGLFGFAQDSRYWDALVAGFPNMTAGVADMVTLTGYLQAQGVDKLGAAPNVLLVGSTDAGLAESQFSDSDPDVFAVGEDIFTLGGKHNGTSFSAPQLTGLASYLWLLSDELRNREAKVTRRAILENARPKPGVGRFIDAYETALSLDEAILPSPTSAPVRHAILDADEDGFFSEADVRLFLDHYFDPKNPANAVLSSLDFSRYDLNGDGNTGGAGTERFDLDRVGSTRFGAAQYGSVKQTIGGGDVVFNEAALTDLQILCYYAFSDLYQGASPARDNLLLINGRCVNASVTVLPGRVSLLPNQTQSFTAAVTGLGSTLVTWTTSGGSISGAGLFTAPATPGTYVVTATSVADPTISATATVIVQGAGGLAVHVLGGTGNPTAGSGPFAGLNSYVWKYVDNWDPITGITTVGINCVAQPPSATQAAPFTMSCGGQSVAIVRDSDFVYGVEVNIAVAGCEIGSGLHNDNATVNVLLEVQAASAGTLHMDSPYGIRPTLPFGVFGFDFRTPLGALGWNTRPTFPLSALVGPGLPQSPIARIQAAASLSCASPVSPPPTSFAGRILTITFTPQ